MKIIVFLLLIIYLLQIVNSLPAGGDEAILTRTSAANLQCGGSSRYKIINIKSPTVVPRSCSYKVTPLNSYVCQLRVDIEEIDIEKPTLLPGATAPSPCSCDKDKLTVRDQNIEICDYIRNQHFYIPFDASKPNAQIDLEFTFDSDRSQLDIQIPKWTLKLEQLQCPPGSPRLLNEQTINNNNNNNNNEITNNTNSMLRTSFNDANLIAPKGCFQYYPEPSGIIESFGFNMYLPKMDYSICIKKRDEDTKLKLSGFNAEMSADPADTTAPTTPLFDADCIGDYLFVPIATIEPDPNAQTPGPLNHYYKFCGLNALTSVETNIPGPYVLQFKSDEICSDFEKRFSFRYSVN